MAFQFNGSNQLALASHQKIPDFGRSKVTGQSKQGSPLVNLGVSKPVGPQDVEYQGQEPVHILARRDTRPLALISPSGFNLLPSCHRPISPKSLYRVACFLFVIDEIKSHLFSNSDCRLFFLAQSV